MDDELTCVNFTIERWYPVANMSRYLPIRVYDYYAPGIVLYICIHIDIRNIQYLSIHMYYFYIERFNETIFDALPTYVLSICDVCGSSQCPYCAIYNTATTAKAAFSVVLVSVFTVLATRLFGRGFLQTLTGEDAII